MVRNRTTLGCAAPAVAAVLILAGGCSPGESRSDAAGGSNEDPGNEIIIDCAAAVAYEGVLYQTWGYEGVVSLKGAKLGMGTHPPGCSARQRADGSFVGPPTEVWRARGVDPKVAVIARHPGTYELGLWAVTGTEVEDLLPGQRHQVSVANCGITPTGFDGRWWFVPHNWQQIEATVHSETFTESGIITRIYHDYAEYLDDDGTRISLIPLLGREDVCRG